MGAGSPEAEDCEPRQGGESRESCCNGRCRRIVIVPLHLHCAAGKVQVAQPGEPADRPADFGAALRAEVAAAQAEASEAGEGRQGGGEGGGGGSDEAAEEGEVGEGGEQADGAGDGGPVVIVVGLEVMEEPPAARVAEVEIAARGEGWVAAAARGKDCAGASRGAVMERRSCIVRGGGSVHLMCSV